MALAADKKKPPALAGGWVSQEASKLFEDAERLADRHESFAEESV